MLRNQTSLTSMKNQAKNKNTTEWYVCGKYGVMEANIVCLSCREVEAMEYFKYWV